MRLRQIEVFHAVFVTGSVSGGARALNVSQPTVSKVLKYTEDQLGFLLFDRISGRLVPTDRGRELFDEIEPLFEKMQELRKFTSRLANTKTGRLRIAFTPAFGLEIAPTALAAFSKEFPDITLELETLHANEVVRAIADSAADLGLVFDAPTYAGIASEKLGKTEFVCVAPKRLKLSKSKSVRLKDLEKHPLITLNEKSVLGQILNRRLVDAFDRPVESRLIVETYHIAKRLVKQDAGIAIIDSITAYSGDKSGLSFYRLDPPIVANVNLVTRLNEPKSRHHKRLIEIFEREISSFPAR